MARNPPTHRKDEVVAAIRKQLLTAEATLDMPALYAQFPEVPQPTIWRWANLEKNQQPTQRQLTQAAQAIEERVAAGAAGDLLPAVPSPAAIARDGGKALRKLDFGAEIPKLYSDAEMLRAFAVKDVELEDGQHVERIKNPVAFEKSIKARASLIETSLKVLQEVWDMRAMQAFNEMIVEEIGRESPECQRRILQRLALLNQRHGISMGGFRV